MYDPDPKKKEEKIETEPKYNYEDEIANAEPDCCEECHYYGGQENCSGF